MAGPHAFDALTAPVEALMRTVAAEIVMPRFRNLRTEDVAEKAANDLVTIADIESEARLREGLAVILPEAGFLGEEACAADPALLHDAGNGLIWVVDPIDGTGNFAAGRAPFGIIVALVDSGETLAGWILDAPGGRLCRAETGAGAWIDGHRVTARETGEPLPVAALATAFMQLDERDALMARIGDRVRAVDIPRCAAEQYPRLVLGQNDLSLFARALPWDHAAGTLFLNEAGGRCARLDGAPYRVGDARPGLIGASSPRLWDMAAGWLR